MNSKEKVEFLLRYWQEAKDRSLANFQSMLRAMLDEAFRQGEESRATYKQVRCKHCDESIPDNDSKHDHICWYEFMHSSLLLCGMCGNTGWIDTRDCAWSPRGVPCGMRAPCICPNGRRIKESIDSAFDSGTKRAKVEV